MIIIVLFSLTAAVTFLNLIKILGLLLKVEIGMPMIGRFSVAEWYSFYPAFLFQVFWWVLKYWEYLTK